MKLDISQLKWTKRRVLIGISLLLILVVSVDLYFVTALKDTYRYRKLVAANGVELNVITTTPRRIELDANHGNIASQKRVGINGGFFYNHDLLSIAVQNHTPVNGQPRAYGSGWFNAKYSRGTLVWDGYLQHFSVQAVQSVDDLDISDRMNYWAQGGISMNLQNDNIAHLIMYYQNLPALNEPRMRSGMVYDSNNNLYLIVSPTACTAAQFREAIQEMLLPGKFKEGIFLDGDGSSQMYTRKQQLAGDTRTVVQMVVVK